ncbi:MAG: hypothetical protein M3R02_13220, partial [Chloroflexota bacterium]|nr:hypothetical protein [Chloroflexota bacterium]
LTPLPFPDGGAKVLHVAEDGTVTEAWTGLTAVTGVTVGADGTLYATELSTGNPGEPPFLVPGSGRVVRQTGPDSLEVVAGGLMFPVAVEMGPDGGLYVALPAIGADRARESSSVSPKTGPAARSRGRRRQAGSVRPSRRPRRRRMRTPLLPRARWRVRSRNGAGLTKD